MKKILVVVALVATIFFLAVVPAVASPDTGCGVEYTVVRGDTLTGIAAKCKVPYSVILAINNFQNPNRIHPGDKVNLLSVTQKPVPQKLQPEVIRELVIGGVKITGPVEKEGDKIILLPGAVLMADGTTNAVLYFRHPGHAEMKVIFGNPKVSTYTEDRYQQHLVDSKVGSIGQVTCNPKGECGWDSRDGRNQGAVWVMTINSFAGFKIILGGEPFGCDGDAPQYWEKVLNLGWVYWIYCRKPNQ